jgi:hypothetical protein
MVIAISTSIFAEGKKTLPDLFIVGTTFRATGPPSLSGENIVVPFELKIQNSNWGGAAGPFQLSIMCQYPPPAAPMETELEFTGTRTFSGLEPGRAINVSGQIAFPKSQTGKKVKIRAIVDSMTQVSESIETNNASPWLEVQLPPLELRRPPVKVIPKGVK